MAAKEFDAVKEEVDTWMQDARDAFVEWDAEHAVIFTNGCFDGFHAGHLQMLKAGLDEAYEKHNVNNIMLVVGVDSDLRYEENRGNPPRYAQRDRAEVVDNALQGILRTMQCTMHVSVFPLTMDPAFYIRELRPHMYFKGRDLLDHPAEDVVHDLVALTEHGGRLYIVPVLQDSKGKLSSSRKTKLEEENNEHD